MRRAADSGDYYAGLRARIALLIKTHSQAEIARKTGVPRSSLSRYLRDRRPGPDFCAKLVSGLGVNPVWLLVGQGSPLLSDVSDEVSRTTGNLLELVRAMHSVARMRMGALVGRPHAVALRDLNDSLKSYRELRRSMRVRTQPLFEKLITDLDQLLQGGQRIPPAAAAKAGELVQAGIQVAELCDEPHLAGQFTILHSYYEMAHGNVARAAQLQQEVLLKHVVKAGISSDQQFMDVYNFASMLRVNMRAFEAAGVCRAALALAPPGSAGWPNRRRTSALLGGTEIETGNLGSGTRRLQRSIPHLGQPYQTTFKADLSMAQLYAGLVDLRGACALTPDSPQKARLMLSFACFQEQLPQLQWAADELVGDKQAQVRPGSAWGLLAAGLLKAAQRDGSGIGDIEAFSAPRWGTNDLRLGLEFIKHTFAAQVALLASDKRAVKLVKLAEATRKQLPRRFRLDLLTPAIHWRNVLRLDKQRSTASLAAAARRARAFFRRYIARGYACFNGALAQE